MGIWNTELGLNIHKTSFLYEAKRYQATTPFTTCIKTQENTIENGIVLNMKERKYSTDFEPLPRQWFFHGQEINYR